MRKKYLPILFFIILFTINLLFCTIVQSHPQSNNDQNLNMELLPVGSGAVDWTMKEIMLDIDITFSSFTGDVILIDFFQMSPSDGPDSINLPHLKEVRATFSSSQLVMMSIDIDPLEEQEADVENYVEENGINWYVFRDTEAVYLSYGVSASPTFYIIDQEQKVAFVRDAITNAETLTSEISALLPSNPTNTSGNTSEIWEKYWYIIVISIVAVIFITVLVIQRQRVVRHNKEIRQQKMEKKLRKQRSRNQ